MPLLPPPLAALVLVGALAAPDAAASAPVQEPLLLGSWDAWLESPGGQLRFGLELRKGEGGVAAALTNGPERIDVPAVSWVEGELVLDIEYYDSRLVARPNENGTRLEGEWSRRQSNVQWTRMPFAAVARPSGGIPAVPNPAAGRVAGRWAVEFSSSPDLAVGVFEARPDGGVQGTFLTTLGDYRYLDGHFREGVLELSCFDGAHAFLFRAELQEDGTLAGDFWSREKWHETWTARRDDGATLPDAFAQNTVRAEVALEKLSFPDLSGEMRSPADPLYAGRARILQLFGSWCPNCNDETRYLVELDERYRERGLSILGLAFELTGDPDRDTEQLRKYQRHHGIEYPLLLVGTANKASAAFKFPYLDRVRAYPTTIFLHADGRVRAVHTGFSGPATGAAHVRLREQFEEIIEELLSEGQER